MCHRECVWLGGESVCAIVGGGLRVEREQGAGWQPVSCSSSYGCGDVFVRAHRNTWIGGCDVLGLRGGKICHTNLAELEMAHSVVDVVLADADTLLLAAETLCRALARPATAA